MPRTAGPDELDTASASQTPKTDAADGIGERLAHYRTLRGLKVSQLARQIGVSPSLISQIERGQSRPSVSTLFALAEAVQTPIDAFFGRESGEGAPSEPERAAAQEEPAAHAGAPSAAREPDSPPAGAIEVVRAGDEAGAATRSQRYLVRSDERAAIDIEGGVRWERLTPTTLDRVEFLELIYAPHAQSHETLYRHPGTEMVLLLSGRIDIYAGFERYELEPGDSIHFPSSLPHRYVNPTDEEARAVTVILHDGEAPSGSTPRRP